MKKEMYKVESMMVMKNGSPLKRFVAYVYLSEFNEYMMVADEEGCTIHVHESFALEAAKRAYYKYENAKAFK